jgi:glycosyltransferase involved in cell wall biosynthesis
VAGVLVGDIERQAWARVKYGHLFDALGRSVPLVAVEDVGLCGVARLANAARVVHPDRRRWRERFYQNVPAFAARSRLAARRLDALAGRFAVALQVGALFDARWGDPSWPSVIYTDYTMRLSERCPEAGRSPFTPPELERWVALERRAYARAAHVCTRSRIVRDSIVADYGVAPERVTVAGGGVNLAALPDLPPRAGGEPPVVLFIGKELHRKGGDLLLAAFARARRAVPDARLRLVTSGPIPRGVPLDGVEVVAPTWDRARIAALYRQADIFVLPSRLETWGDVLLEAMAFGLPCIGVAGEAMEEIVAPDVTGALVPPEDVDALAAALRRLLPDPDLRRRWGAAGRRRVEAKFTWERVVERLAPALERAALGPAAEARSDDALVMGW